MLYESCPVWHAMHERLPASRCAGSFESWAGGKLKSLASARRTGSPGDAAGVVAAEVAMTSTVPPALVYAGSFCWHDGAVVSDNAIRNSTVPIVAHLLGFRQ